MMSPLDLVGLSPLMARGQGRAEIRLSLIDGPVALNHPDLAGALIQTLPAKRQGMCARTACTLLLRMIGPQQRCVTPDSRTFARLPVILACCSRCPRRQGSHFVERPNGVPELPRANLHLVHHRQIESAHLTIGLLVVREHP